MRRDIYNSLTEWRINPKTKPLLLRGARQVGKSYIINKFGENEFSNFITINFERNPEFKDIFTTFNPFEIKEKIILLTGKDIVIGKTLLFFDEIQECPKAITSLRYFHEEIPELHIIGAGSLLEFALKSEDVKVPVGRIQYLYMYPLSFAEFLDAAGENTLRKYISQLINIENITTALHDKLIGLVSKYNIIGGMPAVVSEYIENGNIVVCQKIQRSIIDTYTDDFGKYSKNTQIKYLRKVFYATATMVGQKFVYSHVDNSMKSRDLKNAVELLEQAGVVQRIKRTNGDGLPLEANIKDNFFKLLFLDVGLLHSINGIYEESISTKMIASIFNGAVAEQFVGQELLTIQSVYTKPALFYWAREAKNSSAEIDYLISHNAEIIPIEVKSGKSEKMVSLNMFIKKYKSKKGIRISQSVIAKKKNVLSIPYYGIRAFFNDGNIN